MQNQELDHRKQSEQFWERFRLYNENERIEKSIEIHRWAAIYNRYKLTKENWQVMLDKQNGCCAICGAPQENLSHPLEIDQDHATGKIRGLICRKCNSGIALLGDDIERLKKAIVYLES
jgi:Autographiviridae endonuclease VII